MLKPILEVVACSSSIFEAILSHSTEYALGSLILKSLGSRVALPLSFIIMLVAAVGAVAVTIGALPALDRFIRW